MGEDGILFLHLLGVLLLVGGSVAAAALRVAAMRRRRPSEVALLLGAVRPVVPLVGGGLLLAVGAGFWLASRLDVDLGATWLVLAYLLIAWLGAAGAIAGRQDRGTRELAERLAGADDAPSDDLARRLRDPLNLALNGTMLLAVLAIVALMVWKPGS
jgi:uncharacterized membrane protein